MSVFPNPFKEETFIGFTLKEESHIKLEIFNLTGKKVTKLYDNSLPAGDHQLSLSGNDLFDGIYFCRLQVGDNIVTRKIVKMK